MRGPKSALRALVALALVASPLLSASCENIVGIEDRTLGPCGHYCDVVMANCTGDNVVYDGREKCMGVCKHFELGDSNEWQGHNTLECRLHEAELVPGAAGEDKATFCRAAGPEGLTSCGGSCESYCTLYEQICGQTQCGGHDNCVEKCAALRDNMEYNVVTDYEGDSLQCRFVHLSNASITPGGQPHCGHANLQTPTDHCTDVPDGPLGVAGAGSTNEIDVSKPPSTDSDCRNYCRPELVACGTTQYENEDECMALCKYFDPGEFADTDQKNTLGCRIYHSYNALCSPELHCPHSGPGGEGTCGSASTGKCESYCRLAQGVCPDVYSAVYADDDACMQDCTALPDAVATDTGPLRYNTTYAQTPGTVACRLLAVSRAAVTPSLCADAATSPVFGKGDCAAE
jgi:hypothetical protein